MKPFYLLVNQVLTRENSIFLTKGTCDVLKHTQWVPISLDLISRYVMAKLGNPKIDLDELLDEVDTNRDGQIDYDGKEITMLLK